MSKHFSNRYVGKQSSRKPCSPSKYSNHGSLVETLICIGIGAIVFYCMCLMAFSYIKPLKDAISSFEQSQSSKIDFMDDLLAD